MKNILLVVLVVLLGNNSVAETNENSELMGKLAATLKVAAGLSEVTGQMLPQNEFRKLVAESAALGVTNACAVLSDTMSVFQKAESDITTAVSNTLSAPVTIESLTILAEILRLTSNGLVAAKLDTKLVVACAQVERADRKKYATLPQLEVMRALELSKWKERFETQWNRNDIIIRQVSDLMKIDEQMMEVITDMAPIVSSEEMSVAVVICLKKNLPSWCKAP